MHSITRDVDQLQRLRVLPHRPLTPHGVGGVNSEIQPQVQQREGDLFRPVQVGRLRLLPHRPLQMHSISSRADNVVPHFVGRGSIIGTTKVTGTPDLPKDALVRLYVRAGGQLVAQTRSTDSGAYQFNNLNSDLLYTVVAHDETNTFNAVIADNLEPTL